MPDIFDKLTVDERVVAMHEAARSGGHPYFRRVETRAGAEVRIEGRDKLMFGSGNYLGLAADPRVASSAIDAAREFGVGLTGSRLTNGTIPLHEQLEYELAQWMRTEAAIVFTTGYQTNLGCLAALLGPDDTAIYDAASHASLIDGIALSGARARMFRHNSVERLERTLERAKLYSGGSLVVVDGVYSMEGHLSPLEQVTSTTKAAGARLMVDEAHALGVLGARNAGSAELFGVEREVDVRMGTFSKSIGCLGGFIAGSQPLIDFLRVASRPFVFTASATPPDLAATLTAVGIARSDEGLERAALVRANARRLREGLANVGIAAPTGVAGDLDLSVPIVSIPMRHEAAAIDAWRKLWEDGIYTNMAVFPAVPQGAPLIRMTVSALHDQGQIDCAVEAAGGVASLAGGGEPVAVP